MTNTTHDARPVADDTRLAENNWAAAERMARRFQEILAEKSTAAKSMNSR